MSQEGLHLKPSELHAAGSTFDAGFEVSIVHYQFSILTMEPREKESPPTALAMPHHASGHGDLPIACANPRDGAQSRVRSLLFVTKEATSARVALLLRAKRITRVRPLDGGIEAWLASNLPFVTENLVNKPVVL